MKTAARVIAAALLVVLMGACVDSEKIYTDRPVYDDPPSAAGGFLGYSNAEAKLTICGSCHVGRQAQWKQTAHYSAWEDLQGSGHAAEFCENCHTVSELGNNETGDVGWTSTGDTRYLDVQCESCHGPGQTHVAAPDVAPPLAPLRVGLDLTTGCGECHQGTHHPFVEQWEQSSHSKDPPSFAANNPECIACHRGQGTLIAWGARGDYQEKDSDEALPVVCGVCHDPHDTTFEGQLRFPVRTASYEIHLCARCHNRRPIPDPESSHGLAPHSPETELLQGTAGWVPPGVDFPPVLRGTHGSSANEKLCATCHVEAFEVTDEATGEFVLNSVGHLFTAIPCVNDQGIPVPGTCAFTTQVRRYEACATSGCHSSDDRAAELLSIKSEDIMDLANALLDQLKVVDPGLDAPGGEIDPTNPTLTVAEGAFFNFNLTTFPEEGEEATEGNVAGSTTHNPFLIEALLVASIEAVEDEYGVSPLLGIRDLLERLRGD